MPHSTTISERLAFMLSLTETKPKTFGTKLWKLKHGNWYIGVYSLVLGVIAVTTSLLYDLTPAELPKILFFFAIFIGLGTCLMFWGADRQKAETVLVNLIEFAQYIEKGSSKKQMLEMEKIPKLCKMAFRFLAVSIFTSEAMYFAYPFVHGSPAGNIPILPAGTYRFWFLIAIQDVIFATGPASIFSLVMYQFEMCLCLSALNNVFAEQFEKDGALEDPSELIKTHQTMLNIASSLSKLLADTNLVLIVLFVQVLVVNSVIAIISQGLDDPLFIFVLPAVLFMLYVMYALSELVAASAQKVSDCIYRADWLNATPFVKGRLLIVLTRGQRPPFLKARLIGNLDLPKFQHVMSRWYQLVQALLNFAHR